MPGHPFRFKKKLLHAYPLASTSGLSGNRNEGIEAGTGSTTQCNDASRLCTGGVGAPNDLHENAALNFVINGTHTVGSAVRVTVAMKIERRIPSAAGASGKVNGSSKSVSISCGSLIQDGRSTMPWARRACVRHSTPAVPPRIIHVIFCTGMRAPP